MTPCLVWSLLCLPIALPAADAPSGTVEQRQQMMNDAVRALKNNQLAQAIELCERALQRDDHQVVMWSRNLGLIYQQTGQFARALTLAQTSAAEWIAANDAHPDFDLGVVAAAALPKLVADKPETAMSLAQSINDAALRANTLRTLALKWAESDAAAAAHYMEASASVSSEERASVLGEIRPSRG